MIFNKVKELKDKGLTIGITFSQIIIILVLSLVSIRYALSKDGLGIIFS